MPATSRMQKEMIEKKQKEVLTETDLLKKLQAAALARGCHGIVKLAKSFKVHDDSQNGSLSFDEFNKGLQTFGLREFTAEERRTLFQQLDTDKSGTIDFTEFIYKLQPEMPSAALALIDQAFQKFDVDKSGEITIEDLKNYTIKSEPNSGLKADFTPWLNTYEQYGAKDGKVTKQEFESYYAGVWASCPGDNSMQMLAYFDLVMRQAWDFDNKRKLYNQKGYAGEVGRTSGSELKTITTAPYATIESARAQPLRPRTAASEPKFDPPWKYSGPAKIPSMRDQVKSGQIGQVAGFPRSFSKK